MGWYLRRSLAACLLNAHPWSDCGRKKAGGGGVSKLGSPNLRPPLTFFPRKILVNRLNCGIMSISFALLLILEKVQKQAWDETLHLLCIVGGCIGKSVFSIFHALKHFQVLCKYYLKCLTKFLKTFSLVDVSNTCTVKREVFFGSYFWIFH